MTHSSGSISVPESESLAGEVICIVGRCRFQNELLGFFLKKEAGARCMCVESLQELGALKNERPGPSVVLIDCAGVDPEKVVTDLVIEDKETLSKWPVCLFDVPQDMDIEPSTVQAGVNGFFYRYDSLEHFLKGIRVVSDGELWISRKIMSACVLNHTETPISNKNRDNYSGLTPREYEILSLIAVGTHNADIADKLCISPHTVKTHIYNIFKKIDVPNRLQAALWAAKNL